MANQINIQVGADIKNLQEGIKTAVSTLEKGGKDMSAVSESVSRLTSNNFKTLSQAYRTTSKDAEVLALHLGTESDAFKQAASMAQAYGNQLGDVKAKIAGIDMGTQPIQKAAGQFNSLGASLNQITRELPAFTYSMQTGFMAISNNIPMFVDQIASIKKANMELAATGQPVQSAFKQVLGSFLSWQTALSLGVTVLTVYGAEIIKFFTGVKQSKEELEKLAAAQDALNKKIRDYLMTDQQKAIFEEEEAHKQVTDAIKSRIKSTQVLEDQYGRVSNTIKTLTLDEVLANEKAKKELEIAELRYQERIKAIKDRYKQKELKAPKEVKEKEFKFSGQFDNKVILEANASLDSMKQKLLELKPIGTDAFVSLGGEVNKLGVFFDELGEKVGGWGNLLANSLANAGAGIGQALMEGGKDNLNNAGKAIVKQLGSIALQIGAAMIAVGIPQAAVGLPSGFGYIAGGTALTIVGGAMMASGVAPNSGGNNGGGAGQSMGSSSPAFTPDFAASSQYLMLDSRVRGTDIIISADNQRRQNRRIR